MAFKWAQYTGTGHSSADVTGCTYHGNNTVDVLAFKRADAYGTISSGGANAMGVTASSLRTSNPILLRPLYGYTTSAANPYTSAKVENMYVWMFENSSGQDGAVPHSNNRSGGEWGFDTVNAVVHGRSIAFSRPADADNTTNATMSATSKLEFGTERTAYPGSGLTITGSSTTNNSNTYFIYGDWVYLQLILSGNHESGPGGQSLFCIQYDIVE